jgi:hypothetical protein
MDTPWPRAGENSSLLTVRFKDASCQTKVCPHRELSRRGVESGAWQREKLVEHSGGGASMKILGT